MIRSRLGVSLLFMAGVSGGVAAWAMTSGAATPAAEPPQNWAAPVPRLSAPSSGPIPQRPPPKAATLAPVYQDADSLAFREIVHLPTEFTDRKALAQIEAKDIVPAKLLGFNDFHGSLLTERRLEGHPIGGAAVLASYLREHSKGYEGRTVIAHAGDFVGASPAESALFQDEPSIEFFNRLSNGKCDRDGHNPQCNLLGILGNHEFDEGTTEMQRLVRGGNHARGPFFGMNYRGEVYPTICANVVDRRSGRPLLTPSVVKDLGGVKVGFVGAVLAGASWFLTKSGIADAEFRDEVTSINDQVEELKRNAVRAIVVVIHQGGRQRFSRDLVRDGSAVSGEIAGIVAKLDGEVDVVLSGHSHSVLSALLPNRDGKPTLVTQAFHSGTAFADIDLDLARPSGDVVSKRARIVTTFADTGPGLVPDAAVANIVEAARAAAYKTTHRVVGQAAALISSGSNPHGESPLGDIVADAQRAALRTDMAFTTPSWVRADVKPGPITWGDLYSVQPFGNPLARVRLLGKQVIALLAQQWSVETYSRILHVSGLTYTWDATKPPNERIVDVTVAGKPIEPDRLYVAAINEFLAEGGEGFSILAQLPRKPSTVRDIDALVAYVRGAKTLASRIDGRIRRVDLTRGP